MSKQADRIASQHGCEILPTATNRVALCVERRHSLGSPADDHRIERCRQALESAGISTAGWVS